ncbi:MAG TPA: benenodin family lasso peptide [Sphingobium sp.]|uniref:benenodin family lasso peptide n=1 Tax=Sphingobium sp. TaxID=1912891 RepID=UPI002ED59272
MDRGDAKERIMQQNDATLDAELIDLGAVSEETKGLGLPFNDGMDGRQPTIGLTND